MAGSGCRSAGGGSSQPDAGCPARGLLQRGISVLPASDPSAITAAISLAGPADRSAFVRRYRPWGGGISSNGRVVVSSSASLTSGVAGRYATALFEIAKEEKTLDRVEADLDAFAAALAESDDLRGMIASPIHSRADQGAAIRALAARMDLGPELAGTLGVMAANRRLFVVEAMIAAVKGLIAVERGETTAEVRSARPLTDSQTEALAATLRERTGKTVRLAVTVDESLIGGLVVKVGSRMIDTSIRSKLAKLQNVMKEVG